VSHLLFIYPTIKSILYHAVKRQLLKRSVTHYREGRQLFQIFPCCSRMPFLSVLILNNIFGVVSWHVIGFEDCWLGSWLSMLLPFRTHDDVPLELVARTLQILTAQNTCYSKQHKTYKYK